MRSPNVKTRIKQRTPDDSHHHFGSICIGLDQQDAATTRAITAKMNDCCRAIVHHFHCARDTYVRTNALLSWHLMQASSFDSLLVLRSAIFCDLFLCVRYLLLIEWPVATSENKYSLFSIHFVLFDPKCAWAGAPVFVVHSSILNCTHCWILFAHFPSHSSSFLPPNYSSAVNAAERRESAKTPNA